jgi:hypothetical protein
VTDAATILRQRRTIVLRDLTDASGDASLCSISKSAGPVPGVKYLEGRMAALMEVERAVSRGAEASSVAADTVTAWTGRLHGAQRNEMSADWTAYYAGGVDESEELVARLG